MQIIEPEGELVPFGQLDVRDELRYCFKPGLQLLWIHPLSLTQRAEFPYPLAELIDQIREADTLTGAAPINHEPFGVHSFVFQQPLGELHHVEGVVIPPGGVVAFPGPASDDTDPVHPLGEGPEDKGHVHPARAVDADEPYCGGVL